MLHLRPHHGICILNFVGRGYDEAFTRNMEQIVRLLKEDENQEVWLKTKEDVLCQKCPNCQGRCSTFSHVERIDAQTLEACGVSDDSRISFGIFTGLVRERILETGLFDEICGTCKWYDFCKGIMACRRD